MKEGPTIIESYKDSEPHIKVNYRLSAVIEPPTARYLTWPNTPIGRLLCAIANRESDGSTVHRTHGKYEIWDSDEKYF